MTATLTYDPSLTGRATRPPRVRLLGSSVLLMITAPLAAGVFAVWITAVCLWPITVFAPLLLPATALVRAHADVHRRWAGWVLGTDVTRPYRPTAGPWFARTRAVLSDPASWRDALWLFVHSILGCLLSALSFALFAGGLFYLIYPFLYWVTPPEVFNRPFGFYELHSVRDAFVVVPLGPLCLGFWYASVVPLAAANARLMRRLLVNQLNGVSGRSSRTPSTKVSTFSL